MRLYKFIPSICLTLAVALIIGSQPILAADTAALLKTVKSVGPNGAGHAEAQAALQALQQLPPTELPTLLRGLDGADPLPANWLRGAIETLFDRAKQQPPAAMDRELTAIIGDVKLSPRARRLAHELLTRMDRPAAEKLLAGMLDDPALELRRAAIEHALGQSAAAENPTLLARLLGHARDLDQIEDLAGKLRAAKQTVDLPRQMGFVMNWRLIGPFDNRDKAGFNVVYPPEREFKPDATYEGLAGAIGWKSYESTHQYGLVDLNEALGKHKGAAAYAWAEFTVRQETPCELRFGCINANKLWLNGELLFEREVYHARTGIDQYVARAVLKPGRNMILLKVLQNEQTEPWAQEWAFQLRVCDSLGTAIPATDRPPTPAEALEPPPEKKK